MLKIPTTLILGAGASQPYNFPSGVQLANDIARNAYDGTLDLFERDQISSFEREFSHFHGTIDSFLSKYIHHQELGKYLITRMLSNHEVGNEVMRISHDNSRWYSYFFETFINGETNEEIIDNLKHLRVITFNYERSFEYWFWNRIKYGHMKSNEDMDYIMRNFQIVHVHGQIGYLGWEPG